MKTRGTTIADSVVTARRVGHSARRRLLGAVADRRPPFTRDVRTQLLRAADERTRLAATPSVLFADSGYTEVLLNWLVAADTHDSADPIVCALDERLHEMLIARGFTSVHVPWEGSLATLWLIRVQVIKLLIDHGYPVLHTDADAVWLGDPMPDIDALAECEIIASQGTVWPYDALEAMGIVVCCGFFALRPSERTSALLVDVIRRLRRAPRSDDQAAFNQALVERGMHWDLPEPTTAVTVHDREIQLFAATAYGKDHLGVRAALLPHTKYQRVQLDVPAVVAHHLSNKVASAKLDQLAASNCLFLRPDWRDITFTRATVGRLRRRSKKDRRTDSRGR